MMWQYFNQTEPVFAAAWNRELHKLSRCTVPSVSIRLICIHPRPLLPLSDSITVQEEFSSRFAGIKILEPVLAFTENPFVGDVQVTSDCVITIKFEVEKALFEDQLIDLQHNNILK